MRQLTELAVLALGLSLAHADKTVEAGPRGGRILEKSSPKAEFFVEKDQTVTITFYDEALKPVPAKEQNVTVIVDTKEGKKKIEFGKNGDALSSREKLPEGNGYNVVVQLRQSADSKPQNFRFKLQKQTCAGCARAEYACVCDE